MTDLENFDLTGSTVKQFRISDVTVISSTTVCHWWRVGLDLNAEWNAFLASVLARCELSTDAVNLDKHSRVTVGIPLHLDAV